MGLKNVIPFLPAIASGVNAISTGFQNRANRKFAEKMYKVQRRDALADWDMMNSYNSPTAQMARYRDAGLSPHLIYGQANEGAVMRGGDKPSYQGEAPRLEPGAMMAHYDIALKEAQTDNVRANSDVLLAEVKNKALNAAKTILENKKLLQDTEQGRELFAYTVDALKANIENLRATTKGRDIENNMAIDTYDVRKALTGNSLYEGLARIENMLIGNAKTRQEIEQIKTAMENMRKDTEIKKLEIAWRKGDNTVRNPSDPTIIKTAKTIMDAVTEYTKGIGKDNKALRSYMPGHEPYGLPERFRRKFAEIWGILKQGK